MTRVVERIALRGPAAQVWRTLIFLVVVVFLVLILYRQVSVGFAANPGLNSLILLVLGGGIAFAFAQFARVHESVRWFNSAANAGPDGKVSPAPALLRTLANYLYRGDTVALSSGSATAIVDSVLMRIEAERNLAARLMSLAIFLGFIGTLWGFLQALVAVSAAVQALNVSSGDSSQIFADLKAGLLAPVSGMAIAFSTSVFGIGSAFVLAVVDSFVYRAQNQFVFALEDWLTKLADPE